LRAGTQDSEVPKEKEEYIVRLLEEKPWLERSFLLGFTLEDLREDFPLFVCF